MANTITRYQDYMAQAQRYMREAQAKDPAFQAWQREADKYTADGGGAPAWEGPDYFSQWFQTLTPAQQADYQTVYQDVDAQQGKSLKGRIGSTLKVAVPALVGGAALAGTGLLGAGAQSFVGGAPLGGAGTGAVSSLTPEIAAAMAGAGDAGAGASLGGLGEIAGGSGLSTGFGGAGTITGGSGSMLGTGLGGTGSGLGVSGGAGTVTTGSGSSLYSLAGPAAGGGGLFTGLGGPGSILSTLGNVGSAVKDYTPLISAGAGVLNSALGGPDLPSSPNYSALLKQQTEAENALYDKQIRDSRVNQTGPDGSQTWAKDANGQWTLSTSLNPAQQGLYDQQQNISGDLLGNADASLAQPLSMDGIPAINYGTVDANGMPNYNQTVADAYYRQGTRYLDPQSQQDQSSLEARLGQQGFVPGTPAYNQAMQNFMDTKNRAYGSARDFATTQGFTTGLQNAQFGNQARGQSLAEMLALRNQPLNELNAFRTGSQVSTPQWNAQYSTPSQQAPQVTNNATQGYNANLGQYNAGVAQNQATTNNLFGLAGTLANGKYNLFTGMGG